MVFNLVNILVLCFVYDRPKCDMRRPMFVTASVVLCLYKTSY